MVAKLWMWVVLLPKFSWLVQQSLLVQKLSGELFFSPPVSAYNGSYHKFGFEFEAPNLTKKKQIQQPLQTPKIQARTTHSPVRFSVLEIRQQTHH